jgi:hypothetical protein
MVSGPERDLEEDPERDLQDVERDLRRDRPPSLARPLGAIFCVARVSRADST